MRARVEDGDKAVLQKYAEQRGMTLSALLRVTIKNLADIARYKMSQQDAASRPKQ